jgi:hypothetical protein
MGKKVSQITGRAFCQKGTRMVSESLKTETANASDTGLKMNRNSKRFTRSERSWILYDWANSVYATIIMAAVFPIYFANVTRSAGGTPHRRPP